MQQIISGVISGFESWPDTTSETILLLAGAALLSE
jgi:hypothetical protein